MHYSNILYFAGIAVSMYLFFLFAVKPGKTIADRLLMIWQLLATLHLGDIYLEVSRDYRFVPALLGWGTLLALVHGPFLYLYVFHLTTPERFAKKRLLHFLPVVAFYILWLPFLLERPGQKLLFYEQGLPAFYKGLAIFTNISIALSGVGYVIASAVLLYRYKRRIAAEFSNTDKISLHWLRYLIVGIACIWVLVVFYSTPQSIYIGASLYICCIGFFGVRQQEIFKPAVLSVTTEQLADTVIDVPVPEEPEQIKTKYEWSSLTEAEADRIYQQLNTLMAEEKLYKNAELTLSKLAETMQVKDAGLSQVINSRFNKSFYDYINALRVHECIRMMGEEKNKDYTLLSIAFDCGFNSKSSFNRNFRKFTGKSPSAFL
jgi:AraC-like DNA-binding protein